MIFNYLQNAIIIVLIFLSVLSLSIVIDRLVFLHRFRFKKKTLKTIKKSLEVEDFTTSKKLCEIASSLVLFSLIAFIIQQKKTTLSAIEKKTTRKLQEYYDNMEKRLVILNTITSISPLLGILGTVIGMIEAFFSLNAQSIASSNLASAISNALITTALGLSVAIPSIIFYNYFYRRINAITAFLERECLEIIELVKKSE